METHRLIFLLVTPADQPNLPGLLLSQLVGLAGDPDTSAGSSEPAPASP